MCSLAAWDRSGWRDDGVPKADVVRRVGELYAPIPCPRVCLLMNDTGQND